MALITPALPSIDTSTAQFAPQITGLVAGENLLACAPCYIKTSDGKVWMSNATAVNEAAEVVGFTPRVVLSGQPVTLFGLGTRFKYAAAMSPGAILYVGATAGRLDDGATTGDPSGVAIAINATDIVVIRNGPQGYANSVADNAITNAKMADNAVDSAEIAAGAVDLAHMSANSVDSAQYVDASVDEEHLAVGAAGAGLTGLVAKFVAAGNVVGGIPVVHWLHRNAGAAATSASILLTHKTKILFAIFVPSTSVANATEKLVNAAVGDITDAVIAAVSGVATRPTTLANQDVLAGSNLTVTNVAGATAPAIDVYILGIRIA